MWYLFGLHLRTRSVPSCIDVHARAMLLNELMLRR